MISKNNRQGLLHTGQTRRKRDEQENMQGRRKARTSFLALRSLLRKKLEERTTDKVAFRQAPLSWPNFSDDLSGTFCHPLFAPPPPPSRVGKTGFFPREVL